MTEKEPKLRPPEICPVIDPGQDPQISRRVEFLETWVQSVQTYTRGNPLNTIGFQLKEEDSRMNRRIDSLESNLWLINKNFQSDRRSWRKGWIASRNRGETTPSLALQQQIPYHEKRE